MSIAQFKASFKTVSEKSKSIHAGKKRDDLTVSYHAIDESEVSNLDQTKVAKILNLSLIDFGKRLIAESGDDWGFCPNADDITFDNLYDDLTKPSARGNRILSKANLLAYGIAYETYLVQVKGKTAESARVNRNVVEAKFNQIIGQADALAIIGSNLADFEPESETLNSVHNALLELLASLLEPEIKDISKLL